MRKNRGVLPLAMLVLSRSFLLSGCGEEQKQGGEMPPPDVKVVTLKAAPLTVSTELRDELLLTASRKCALRSAALF